MLRTCCTKAPVRDESGHTLINIITTLALIGILGATAVSSFSDLSDPLANASFSTEHFLRLARGNAISNTQAIQVAPVTATRLGMSTSDSCTGTMTAVPNTFLELPKGASMPDTSWTVCFNQRGLSSTNTSFTINDSDGHSKTMRVALGGGTRIDG